VKIRTKTTLLLICLAASALASGTTGCVWRYSPIIDGALSELSILVVDDEGTPVDGVTLCVSFATGPVDGIERKGKTDGEGRFSAKCRTTGSIWIEAKKDGYYRTRLHVDAQNVPYDVATKTRKWSDGPVETRVVLKKIRNPVPLSFHAVQYLPFPETNEVLGFDLEMFDWCPPYGNGSHDDLHMVCDAWKNPDEWGEFHRHLDVSFPHDGDGFYIRSVSSDDAASRFPYDYQADDARIGEKEIRFRFERTPETILADTGLATNEYLVYRVRTQTDGDGRIVHAHYGRIGEGMRQLIGLTMRNWFNPVPNDTNLECTE
jgi:hypothetical protein